MDTPKQPPSIFDGLIATYGGMMIRDAVQISYNLHMTRFAPAGARDLPPLYHWLGAEAERISDLAFMGAAMAELDDALA